jgi:hypothetical protein
MPATGWEWAVGRRARFRFFVLFLDFVSSSPAASHGHFINAGLWWIPVDDEWIKGYIERRFNTTGEGFANGDNNSFKCIDIDHKFQCMICEQESVLRFRQVAFLLPAVVSSTNDRFSGSQAWSIVYRVTRDGANNATQKVV